MGDELSEDSLFLASNTSENPYPAEGLTPLKIAIVGCGAAGVSLLYGLLDHPPLRYQNIQITIFEKGPAFGPGFAYQCDNNELLMNMVSSTTSISQHQETDFWDWILEKGYCIGGEQLMSRSGTSPDGYISRQFFGQYLKSRLEDAIVAFEKLGIKIHLVNMEVINISNSDEGSFDISLAVGKPITFNFVCLCIGNIPPHDVFNLTGKSHYVNNPFPTHAYSSLIKRGDCVGIIGGQLTAADIAVVLANQDHQGPIHFFTRDSNFPLTRYQIKPHELKYLTLANLAVLKNDRKNGISLRDVLRLARKDFSDAGVRWNSFFKASDKNYEIWIQSLLSGDKDYSAWQNLAIETDQIVSDYWNALSSSEKDLFMMKFHRLWLTKRVPIPTHTALKLYTLFKSKILQHHPYLKVIHPTAFNRFSAIVESPCGSGDIIEIGCDWIINASGPSRGLSCNAESLLIGNLFKSGMVIENPHGGIMLEYESSLVKSCGDQVCNGFYAIGHLTSGTYYFVSSLDMVSLRAKRVAGHLIDSLSNTRTSRSLKNPNVYERAYVS